jgi:hypothetical protein
MSEAGSGANVQSRYQQNDKELYYAKKFVHFLVSDHTCLPAARWLCEYASYSHAEAEQQGSLQPGGLSHGSGRSGAVGDISYAHR